MPRKRKCPAGPCGTRRRDAARAAGDAWRSAALPDVVDVCTLQERLALFWRERWGRLGIHANVLPLSLVRGEAEHRIGYGLYSLVAASAHFEVCAASGGHSGFCVFFGSPLVKGLSDLRDVEHEAARRLRGEGRRVEVSNDYATLVVALEDYMRGVERKYFCDCGEGFRDEDRLNKHIRGTKRRREPREGEPLEPLEPGEGESRETGETREGESREGETRETGETRGTCEPRERVAIRTPRRPRDECLRLSSEADLHGSVVRFMDVHYGQYEIFMYPEFGAMQETPEQRRLAWFRGYCKGQPDLTIYAASGNYTSLGLEFKSPTMKVATPAASQARAHASLGRHGQLVVVTRSFEEAIVVIENYLRGARIHSCACGKRFCAEEELARHQRAVGAARKRQSRSDDPGAVAGAQT